ncbi:MAG: saccharopine dehydrogenase NADP-binding domain-containing protein, partial [Pseudomonadales bacterium]|nr:saccharopine dehydrogenase NADP-binding domain-containing protein [Pseudomonadales bacterium]
MKSQRKVAILGAGKIGGAIAKLLHHSGDYAVTVIDQRNDALKLLEQQVDLGTEHFAITDVDSLAQLLTGYEAVISACSFDVNVMIAEAALKTGVSYFDLTEDVATTEIIRSLANGARKGQVFMPQCGLAPGFIGILAADIAQRFAALDTIKMRVGALPKYPSNRMMYNLTWSTDGLINEYCNLCEAIEDGKRLKLVALEGLECFSLDGLEYEAFNTSGGLGTLCETLSGKVTELNYKTVRYKGHQYLMQFLTQELQLGKLDRRNLLKQILETSIPITKQDVVLTFVTVKGWRDGMLEQITDARKIYHRQLFEEDWSAIQLTTAAGVCAVVDMFFNEELPQQGFIKQEQVAFPLFLQNRFG